MLQQKKPGGFPCKFTEDEARQMYELNLKRYSMVSIAKHFNTSNATVSRMITKYKTGGFKE